MFKWDFLDLNNNFTAGKITGFFGGMGGGFYLMKNPWFLSNFVGTDLLVGEDQCLSGDIVLLCVLSAFKKTDVEVIIRIRFFFFHVLFTLFPRKMFLLPTPTVVTVFAPRSWFFAEKLNLFQLTSHDLIVNPGRDCVIRLFMTDKLKGPRVTDRAENWPHGVKQNHLWYITQE